MFKVHLNCWCKRFHLEVKPLAVTCCVKVRSEEEMAYADWINSNLANDSDVKHLLPLAADGKDLYQRISDGILIV